MFYKHWKKIALALTGFFWASCDDSASSAVCLYGPDPNYSDPAENPVSSSSETTGNETGSSSSETTKPESSSSGLEKNISSSEASRPESSSSDIGMSMPLYGVIMDKTVCTQIKGKPTINCNNGVTCTERTEERLGDSPCNSDICPEYGVVQISETTYECDGITYSEAEFRARYGKVSVIDEPEQDSTFNGEMQPVLYGPPCAFNNSCDDEKE